MNEDKLREEFEKWFRDTAGPVGYLTLSETDKSVNDVYMDDVVNGVFCGFKAGAESQQAEIDELKTDCKNLIEINNNQTEVTDELQVVNKVFSDYINNSMWNAQDLLAEIQNLKVVIDVLNETIKEQKTNNKKLREALEEAGNHLYIDTDGIGDLNEARKIIEQALQGDE